GSSSLRSNEECPEDTRCLCPCHKGAPSARFRTAPAPRWYQCDVDGDDRFPSLLTPYASRLESSRVMKRVVVFLTVLVTTTLACSYTTSTTPGEIPAATSPVMSVAQPALWTGQTSQGQHVSLVVVGGVVLEILFDVPTPPQCSVALGEFWVNGVSRPNQTS